MSPDPAQPASTPVRAYLVDDHELVRRGLRDLLGTAGDIEVVGEAASAGEALVGILASKPDVAVLDVRLPDGNGVELCRDVRAAEPTVKCLMLTSYADDDALLAAVLAGASGFVLKQILGHNLVAAVRTVGRGGSLLDDRSTAALLAKLRDGKQTADPLAELTHQEREVFALIGEGLTNRQIAERMFLAEKTIKNYVSRILGKLDMQRRTQVAVMAAKLHEGRNQ
ncbi:response regulator transcription factor [Gordonia sp. zg691]|uniref:Response regulator transcription factor n=1 Tax=Gordonia jinghuaiqii TaxID=2758710 RepID=A0A7D7RT33_9ACTN|nr:response regulator transcription factor [Gordonia jinghuaiqii]MBD0861289.1 response regulator transcription factor [Gordonia jinghuaiqii]MCR5976196.1 response regulator [Gordonia jinghuaiqii]QMT03433.1 response regulator transcription factor [Gordonia jinghuaiqii]